jgi:hypothetical protein
MVNNNGIPMEVNKKPFETVYELKEEYKIPSFEEFMKTYENDGKLNYDDLNGSSVDEVKGYGPCRNTSCGCFCSKDECDCKNPEFSIYKEGSRKIGNSIASGSVGLGGNALSGDLDFTFYRDSRSNGDLKVGTLSAGVDLVNGGAGGAVRLGANIASFKTDGVEVKAGLNLDTGGSISANGVELKLAGFGVSIGEKLEVSTAVGSISCLMAT